MAEPRFTNLDKPEGKYTMIRNEAIYDPRLSLKALGMLVLMRSRPPEWQFHLKELEKHSRDGRDSVRSAVNELVKLGYVRAVQTRREGGKFGSSDYSVTDRRPVDGETVAGETVAGKPVYGKTVDGKPAPSKTDLTKTDLTKTDSSKTEKQSSVSELSEVPQVAELVPQAARVSEAEAFVALWNEHRGPLPACLTLTSKREKGILKFLQEVPGGANPTAVFRAAVTEVAGDAFWAEKKYNLDNLLVPGRVIEKAEKHIAGPAPKRNATEAAERATSLAERIRARREQNQ